MPRPPRSRNEATPHNVDLNNLRHKIRILRKLKNSVSTNLNETSEYYVIRSSRYVILTTTLNDYIEWEVIEGPFLNGFQYPPKIEKKIIDGFKVLMKGKKNRIMRNLQHAIDKMDGTEGLLTLTNISI